MSLYLGRQICLRLFHNIILISILTSTYCSMYSKNCSILTFYSKLLYGMNTSDWSLASQAGWVVLFGLAFVLKFGLWPHMQAERYSWVRLFVFQIDLGHHRRVERYSYVLHLYFSLVLHHGQLKRYSWVFNLYSSLVFDLLIFWGILGLAFVLEYALWHHSQIERCSWVVYL